MLSTKSVVMPMRPRGSSAKTLTLACAAAEMASRVATRFVAALRAEHLGHRVVDAFAEPEQRLPPSSYPLQKFGEAAQCVEHADGALAALEVRRIERLHSRQQVRDDGFVLRILACAARADRAGQRERLIVVVDTLHFGRLQPLTEEVVDGSEEERRIARELLRRVLAPLVTTTAARSCGPNWRSMNSRACLRTMRCEAARRSDRPAG